MRGPCVKCGYDPDAKDRGFEETDEYKMALIFWRRHFGDREPLKGAVDLAIRQLGKLLPDFDVEFAGEGLMREAERRRLARGEG